MRHKASLGMLMLASLAGCETVPEHVKIDVDGRTVEFKKKPPSDDPPAVEPADDEPR